MCCYVRFQLPLGLKRKCENFRENFFAKIDENSGNINDVDYLGNGT
jgi:hypothetical protein